MRGPFGTQWVADSQIELKSKLLLAGDCWLLVAGCCYLLRTRIDCFFLNFGAWEPSSDDGKAMENNAMDFQASSTLLARVNSPAARPGETDFSDLRRGFEA